MNKKVIIAIVVVVIAVVIIAYEPPEEPEPELPAGIFENSNGNYYIVAIPAGKTVEDYFVLTGTAGSMFVSITDVSSYHEDLGTVYYQQVEGGGWVAYLKSKTQRFLYMPESYTKDEAKKVCSHLITNITYNGNCMSIGDAGTYIPCLRN